MADEDDKNKKRRAEAEAALAGHRVLRRVEAEVFTGYRATQFDDMVDKGQLPKPIKLSERSVGWLEEELLSWREFKIAERDGTTIFKTWKEFHAAKAGGWA